VFDRALAYSDGRVPTIEALLASVGSMSLRMSSTVSEPVAKLASLLSLTADAFVLEADKAAYFFKKSFE
jgi:hypothetical protein